MVPMNWRFAAPEIEYLVQDSQAPLIVAEPEFAASDAAARARRGSQSWARSSSRMAPRIRTRTYQSKLPLLSCP